MVESLNSHSVALPPHSEIDRKKWWVVSPGLEETLSTAQEQVMLQAAS